MAVGCGVGLVVVLGLGDNHAVDERAGDVVDVPIAGNVPLDVDTPEDYRAVLAAAGYTEVTA